MFEPEADRKRVERALLVGIEYPDTSHTDAENLLLELAELVKNLDIGVVETCLVKLKKPQARFLTGTGKVKELIQTVKTRECDCIIFDNILSPAQQRNWEDESGVTVVDRQEIILDIFGDRAQTRAAVIQVELARLQYSLPRLKHAWTHLSRQRGGGVTQRGEGEQQLEMDQRIIRSQISKLRKELLTVIKQRDVQRRKRMNVPMPTAAIVGYTNAGKSSLLNLLTNAKVDAEDKLFATLDPTTRRHKLPNNDVMLLTDTVGFVRSLPHGLIEAFKATLEEALVSDFLIQVLDASSPDVEEHLKTTMSVLKELGADKKDIIKVFNKVDLIDDQTILRTLQAQYPDACFISVHSGRNMEKLEEKMQVALEKNSRYYNLVIPHERYDLVSQLYREGAVRSETPEDDGIHLHCAIPKRLIAQFKEYRKEESS